MGSKCSAEFRWSAVSQLLFRSRKSPSRSTLVLAEVIDADEGSGYVDFTDMGWSNWRNEIRIQRARQCRRSSGVCSCRFISCAERTGGNRCEFFGLIQRLINDLADRLCECSQPPTGRAATEAKQVGLFAATGSRDKTIKIWDSMSGQCLKTLVGRESPCFLSSAPCTSCSLPTLLVDDNWVRALIFHPSGKFLISASDDKTIRTWDLASGRCLKTVEAHDHFVTTMAWGRAPAGGTGVGSNGVQANGNSNGVPNPETAQFVNVVATGSVDLTVKVRLTFSLSYDQS